MRGGRKVDKNHPRFSAYRPVVLIKRRYERFNEETREWETKQEVCSGVIVNEACVLTAQHCLEGEKEKTLSISIHTGTEPNQNEPEAYIKHFLTPKKVPSDFIPPSGGPADMAIDIAVARIEGGRIWGGDSLPSSQLHDAETQIRLAPPTSRTPVQVVGYGIMNSNYNEKTEKWEQVGAGIKRDGDLELISKIDGTNYLIETKPGDENQSAGSGDSGGVLVDVTDNKLLVYGVTGSVNSRVLTKVSRNYYTSVSKHRPWIEKGLNTFQCYDAEAERRKLEDLILAEGKPYKKLSAFLDSNPTFHKAVESQLAKAVNLSAHSNSETFPFLRIRTVRVDKDGDLFLDWFATPTESQEQDSDFFRRNPQHLQTPSSNGTLSIAKRRPAPPPR